jgi:hypothetical protein
MRKRQSRPEQVEEAEEINLWLFLRRELAGDLINASVEGIDNKGEATLVRLDLDMVVDGLAEAAPGTWKAIWKMYQHHFIGDRNREAFFTKLHSLCRHIASTALISFWETRRKRDYDADADCRWDVTLLPLSIAPAVLRLAILHPRVLEDFLVRFFMNPADCQLQGSTYRRAILILDAVPEFGWSAEKHTKRLIELGEIKPSESGSEVETIKKFIRDLRHRYKKAH